MSNALSFASPGRVQHPPVAGTHLQPRGPHQGQKVILINAQDHAGPSVVTLAKGVPF